MTDLTPGPESAESPLPGRRRWLMAAVAGAAGLGGGLAWWLRSSPTLADAGASLLWQSTFARPDGGQLSMASLRGRPLLLNFWASWCPPCVEELPMLSDFYRRQSARGWQVLGLAVDQLAPVQRFLAGAPVAFPVALAGTAGIELGKSLGNVSGALPFTVVLGRDGLVAHRKMGKLSPDDLRAWVGLSQA